MQKRVAITGIGVWGCLGKNTEETTAALRAGQSGIGIDEARLTYGYQSALTGIVERPVLKGLLDRRLRVGLPEEGEYAFMASREAFGMAGVDDEYLLANEVGCIFGNDSSSTPVIEAAAIMNEKHDSQLLGSGYIFQAMNSTVTMNLSTIFHLRGINFTVSAACASGSHSVGLGYMMIKQGLQEMVLCGGAQEVNVYSMATFDALGAFSMRMDDPQRASRPFDRDRDGLIPSGGAAALVLEDYDHAVARGANILCEVVGYGFSSNGGGGQHMPWISSTKGMTGHECWMAGASEVVYSILMMQGGFVAPNINFENPDEHSEKLRLATHRIDTQVNTVLSNSFGFGGTNSALVIKK